MRTYTHFVTRSQTGFRVVHSSEGVIADGCEGGGWVRRVGCDTFWIFIFGKNHDQGKGGDEPNTGDTFSNMVEALFCAFFPC